MMVCNRQFGNLLEERQYILECVKGTGEDSAPLYAYVLMKKKRRDAFREALATGDTNLTDFGVVVAYGHKLPPEAFEEKVLAAITSHRFTG